jgi:hypothetical protein
MKQILQQKGQMIVDKLLDCMGPKNQDDLVKMNNASTILQHQNP